MQTGRPRAEDRGEVDGEEQTVTVTLELAASAEPISGRVIGHDGVAREFTGWIAFVRALENAAHQAEREGTDATT
jgi:hypothetical protein